MEKTALAVPFAVGGGALVERAVLGRDERADVVIEVPGELGQGREAEIEDRVDVADQDRRIDPVLAGAVARAVVAERGAVVGRHVTVQPREHHGRAEAIETVTVRGDDDVGGPEVTHPGSARPRDRMTSGRFGRLERDVECVQVFDR